MTDLVPLVHALGRPTVVVIGDLMLDRYVFGRVARISPEAPIQVLRVGREEERPGGAASVANFCTRQFVSYTLYASSDGWGTHFTTSRI